MIFNALFIFYLCYQIKIISVDHIVKENSFRIGIASVVLIIALHAYMYYTADYVNSSFNLFIYLTPALLGLAAQLYSKFKLNGSISFKQTVLAFIIVVSLALATQSICMYLITNYLDPSAKDAIIESSKIIATANQNELAANQLFKEPTFSAGEYIRGFFSLTITYTIIGLISGLIISKVNPPKAS